CGPGLRCSTSRRATSSWVRSKPKADHATITRFMCCRAATLSCSRPHPMRSPPLWRSPNEKGEPKLALSPTTSPVFLFLALREAALRGNRLLSRARAGRHRRLLRDVRARRRDRARHETRVERSLRGKGREL